ncbi:MAG: thioredoxin fold domain-containing protein, partial [Pseudomonadota bacterium]
MMDRFTAYRFPITGLPVRGMLGAAAVVIGLFTPAHPTPAHADPASRPGSPLAGGIEEMIDIPGGTWRAVRSAGRTYFMSANGRYVVEGRAYDLWAGRPLDDFQAVRQSTTRITLAGFDAVWDDLAPTEFGEGAAVVSVFMDPNCPHCHALLTELWHLRQLVRVRVLPLPLFGEDSGRKTRAIHCAADQGAAVEAVLGHREEATLAQKPDCTLEPLHR